MINKQARLPARGDFSKNRVARSCGWGCGALLVVALVLAPMTMRAPRAEATAPAVARHDVAVAPLAASRRGISGVVRIAPAFANRIDAADTLFVTVQSVDGDRAPLVVLRKRAHELPVAFFLDDSTAINPARLPSRHNELVIVARVARRGSAATAAAGDLQGWSAPVRYGQAGVVIVIDSEVK